jgi:hypothetical protein
MAFSITKHSAVKFNPGSSEEESMNSFERDITMK